MKLLSFINAATGLLSFASLATGFIPAQPVNDTSMMNFSDYSRLEMKWYPRYMYQAPVSYQLKGDPAMQGIDHKGALVYFNESSMGENQTTSTPWIALISCDHNETNGSQFLDIFTLARDRGAQAALLYTTTSESCLLSPEYINAFAKPIDVFTTTNRGRAQLIQNQFQNTNQSFWYYNGALLDESSAIVNQSLTIQGVPSRTFLIATLTPAGGSKGQIDVPSKPITTSTSAATSLGRKVWIPHSSLTISLCVIAGVGTTLLFRL